MLTSLSIKNYALIQNAQLQLDKGFTVITGETGAGKSILLGALGLITGKRADTSSAGDPTEKCIVEGVFNVENYNLLSFFKDNDLDYESSTIVRRELLPSGKSRAFVNDTPVTLSQLNELGQQLIDIHSQHKTMEVVDNDYQFEMLDTFSNNLDLRANFEKMYSSIRVKKSELKELLEKKKQDQLDFDYQSYLFSELEEAALKSNEYEDLELELNTLSNADEIMQQLAIAVNSISQESSGSIDLLTEARAALARINSYGEQYAQLYNRVNSLLIELDDLSSELEDQTEKIDADPLTLERLNNRMQLLHNLMQKHQVATVEELIEKRDALDANLQEVQGADDKIAKIEKDIERITTEAKGKAKALHIEREKAIPKLKKSVEGILKELGMPNAQFDIALNVTDTLTIKGGDALDFKFSANKGMELKSLGKGASGGELSRVMLALKSVLSVHKQLPTLIFDEIDTGVSGDIAVKMGAILKKMGHTMQLLSITHLPQIAGQGASHFKVFKKDTEEKTQTYIIRLKEDERITEIAGMLGGGTESSAAIAHAKNLLN